MMLHFSIRKNNEIVLVVNNITRNFKKKFINRFISIICFEKTNYGINF